MMYKCDVCEAPFDEGHDEFDDARCEECYPLENWELPVGHPSHEYLVFYHKAATYRHVDVTVKIDTNGLWGFGYWHFNGCGPPHGRWTTRAEAESAGVEYMNDYFMSYKKGEKSCCCSGSEWRKALSAWNEFYSNRNQLTLF